MTRPPESAEVRVCLAHTAAVADADSFLTPDELERAARFRTQELASDWKAAHAVFRQVIAARLRVEPLEVEFEIGEHGKPSVHGLHVNLSHAAGLCAVVIADHPVGVDVEFIRSDLDHPKLAQRFFSASENDQINSQPPAERLQAFFNCWTRKEAVVKASGRGIAVGLADFDVAVTGDARLGAVRTDDLSGQWWLSALDVPAGYVGAVAIRTSPAHLKVRGVLPFYG